MFVYVPDMSGYTYGQCCGTVTIFYGSGSGPPLPSSHSFPWLLFKISTTVVPSLSFRVPHFSPMVPSSHSPTVPSQSPVNPSLRYSSDSTALTSNKPSGFLLHIHMYHIMVPYHINS